MLTIYNTLARKKEIFKPITDGKVSMYVCGMTVYDFCHVGHARVMVVFDIIARWFRASGYDVTYVRNITDIDDKIIHRANDNHESIQTLTERFIAYMNEDAARLGVIRPDVEPKATDHMSDIIEMIEKLIDKGYAYVADDGDVDYAVRQFKEYGKLSGKSIDELIVGERVEVTHLKRDPLDFVLWKKAKANEPCWDSPWGPGRPGWHIECSAMSCKVLGQHFDIHGGGADLQFPHHENEIAQSEGASGEKFVNYWIHNGFVRVDNEKMSKSLGNFFTLREVLGVYDAEVIRFFILRAHYRSSLNYNDQNLDDAKQALTRLYTALNALGENVAPLSTIDWAVDGYAKTFKAVMDDDFATPQAVAVLFDLATDINKAPTSEKVALLKALGGQLGILQRSPEQFLKGDSWNLDIAEKDIEAMLAERQTAKAARDFARADQIRQSLLDYDIVIEDTADGSKWRKA